MDLDMDNRFPKDFLFFFFFFFQRHKQQKEERKSRRRSSSITVQVRKAYPTKTVGL